MSGPNTITIQVDNSGALTAIREVTGAVQALAEQARTTQVAITALTRAASGQTSSARPAAAAPAQAANPNDEARKKEIAEANKQAEGLQRLIAIHKLEADGSAKARVALVELAKARDLANLAAEQEKEMAAAQAGQIGAIAEHYAILRAAVEETATAQAEAAQKGLAEAEASKKQLETITKGWSDALLAEIMGKTGSMKKAIKDLFKQIAAEAIKSRVIIPISGLVTSIAGAAGISSLLGTATPAAAGGAPGSTSILDSLTGGLDKIVGGLEKGFGKLGETLFGLPGKRGTATEGLFGRAGELFGSTDLAQGVTGALGGAGLGATAAGLLGALGIGKGNTKGGAIGGAIGGAAGSIFGPLGTTVGSLLGGAIGSLFGGKPSNKEGSATIDLNSGNVAVGGFTGKKFSQENRDQASGIANQVLSIKSALEKGFGARITGTLAVGAGDRDGLFATAINSSARTKFKDDKEGAQQLLAYVTGQFVTAIRDQLSPAMSAALGRVDFKDMEKALADLEFIRNFEDSLTSLGEGMGVVNTVTRAAKAEVDTQIQALKDFKEKTARLFPDDVDRASTAMRAYVEELVGITDAAEPMSQLETALMALQARFEAYKPLLEEVGYTAEQAQTAIANGLQKAKDKLKDEFNDSLDRQYNELTGKGYVNQINDLVKTRDAGRRDATALGLTSEKVDRNFGAALDSQFEGLDSAALNDIKTQFQDMAPVVEAADRALAKLNGAVQDAATQSQIARDRRALEIQIMEMQGKSAEALAARRADELAAADASLRPLIEQRHALEDAAKATELATSRRALEIQIMEMQGKSAEALAARRADELAAADASLRPLIEQRHALEDAAKVTELATSRRALEIQIMEMQGKSAEALAARRADELAAADASLRPLIEQRHALEDAAKATELATSRRALEIQIMEMQGKSAEALAARRADELAAADASLRPLIEQRHALEDAAKATELATSRRALEIQIMEMQGKSAEALAARRADELAAAEASLRPFIEQRHALEDAAKATELATSRRALEIQIMEMQGKSAEALAARRADELAAADASLRPLIARRHQLEDEAKAAELATSRRALDIQNMELAGNAAGALAARRADELAAADASLRPLIARRHALEDEARAAELARAARGQEIQILELQGRSSAALALRRREELDAADAVLRPMIAYRHALEDEAAARAASLALSDRLFNATNDATTLAGALAAFDRNANREREEAARSGTTNLVQLETVLAAERANIVKQFGDKSIEEAQAKADQARDTLIAAYEREADAARSLAASWKQAGDGIRAALTGDQLSDQYSGLNPEQRAKLAEDELRRLAARAKDSSLSADERLAAAQALPEARRAFLDAVRPLYEGTERWGAALDLSAQLLDNVALAATREVDIAQQQVDLAQQQLTALGVVNQSVLTVAQALADYQAAQAQVAAARAAAQAPVPSPVSPAGVPANTNQPAKRLDQVRSELLSTPFTTHDLNGTPVVRFTGPNGNSLSLLASDINSRPLDYLSDIARQLGLAGYQQGGVVGNGFRGVDSVLARYQEGGFIGLAGGEFVTRAASVTPDTLPLLRAINDSGRPPPSLSATPDTGRLERLLQDLLVQTSSGDRTLTEVNARGYEALITRLEGLLSQGQEQAADRRRAAR